MTPKWLAKHATIHGSYTYKSKYLEILPGIYNHHVLQVQLAPPGVLTNGDDDSKYVTVTITISMDTVWADSNDHDSSFGISDGERFIGFHILDKYHIHVLELKVTMSTAYLQIQHLIVLVLSYQILHKVTPVRLRYR